MLKLKYLISLILSFAIILLCNYMTYAGETIMAGDGNSDGYIDANDALLALETAVGFHDVSIDSYLRQDTNEDLVIDAKDALNILKHSARLIDTFEKNHELYLNRLRGTEDSGFFTEERYSKKNADAYNAFIEANMDKTEQGYSLKADFVEKLQVNTEVIDENVIFTDNTLLSMDGKLYIGLIKSDTQTRLADMYIINLDGEPYTVEYICAMKQDEQVVIFTMKSEEGYTRNSTDSAVCKGYMLSRTIGEAGIETSLYSATYPETVAYADYFEDKEQHSAWNEWMNSKRDNYRNDEDESLDNFIRNSAEVILTQNDGKNLVYSPINVYMAMSMLTEVTDGNTRAQLLNLSGAKTIEELREETKAIWNAHYRDDGSVESILANSMWLRDDMGDNYNDKTLNNLSEYYYASSFSGQMGSEAYNEELRAWLNEQTKGLLKDSVNDVELPENAVLALTSTIYFRGRWLNTFSEYDTEKGIFYSPSGEVDCDFMNKKYSERDYYWGNGFSAIKEDITNSGAMWFIRPDEGESVDTVLKSEKFMEFILSDGNWDNRKEAMVTFKVPKFDVSSDIELKDTLKDMGVNDILEFETADFSPLYNHTVYRTKLSSLQHGARVSIDEEGCIATAFTLAIGVIESAPDFRVDFILDKPFIFVITSEHGAPLFIGVVNTPN